MLAGVIALVGLFASPAQAQAPTTAGTVPPARSASSGPRWNELGAAQQQALEPLAPHWNGLHAAQKRKWIALSRNFARMAPQEQAVLHSRMTEWAALSAQERARARLNFAEIERLAPEDERKAKWEAYQALSEEEKRRLAERAGIRAPSAAAAVRLVPAQKLAPVPSTAAGNQHPPRIELAPSTGTAPMPARTAPAPQPVEAP